jgi:branched-chain amino acid transport system ATP-binding protein
VSLLRTVQLKKYFGETRAVDHVDFTVREGELMALVGANGAGKTTLVNVISGLLPADSGQIVFLDEDITGVSVKKRLAAGIARSFQIVNLFDDLTAFDNVALSVFSREGKSLNLAALAHRDGDVRDEVVEFLQLFGLEAKRELPARDLAQGERKLLDVAVAYALRPKLLFLDEPTSGISSREKSGIMDVLAQVVRGGNVTAVIIEHDMDVVFRYADRIVVMHQGAILADGTAAQIREHPEVNAVLLGRSEHARG